MRRGSHWTCSECFRTREVVAPEGVICACGAAMTDEAGSSALVRFISGYEPTREDSSARDVRRGVAVGGALALTAFAAAVAALDPASSSYGWGGAVATLLLYLVGALVVGALGAATTAHLLDTRRRLYHAAHPDPHALVTDAIHVLASKPETSVAELTGSAQRIVGRVRVLEAPEAQPAHVALALGNPRRAGRFVIEDASGAALVDRDDMVELFAEGGGTLLLCDGDLVEASGPGRRVELPGAQGGYRGAEGYLFDGEPDEKILIHQLASSPRARVDLKDAKAGDWEALEQELTDTEELAGLTDVTRRTSGA